MRVPDRQHLTLQTFAHAADSSGVDLLAARCGVLPLEKRQGVEQALRMDPAGHTRVGFDEFTQRAARLILPHA